MRPRPSGCIVSPARNAGVCHGTRSRARSSAAFATPSATPGPMRPQLERHFASLRLDELALACACAEGREAAWEHFVREYRPVLYRAASAIDASGGARDLADALYAELFGLTERDGARRSHFEYFHGRSSLATWLRAVLAQRSVDRARAARRLAPLPDEDAAAPPQSVTPARSADHRPVRRAPAHGAGGRRRPAGAARSPAARLLLCPGPDAGPDRAHARRARGHRLASARQGANAGARGRGAAAARGRPERRRRGRVPRRRGRRPRSAGRGGPARAGGRQESGQRPFKVERAQVDEPRRDDVFDRELRRALAAGGGAPASPHVDAELAAAWMDRRLDASATRSIDEHLAGCSDCQAIVATLARLSPDVPAAGEGSAWWRRLRAGWLVPATVAAAAALVIWVAVPQQRATTTEPERATAAPAPATVPRLWHLRKPTPRRPPAVSRRPCPSLKEKR